MKFESKTEEEIQSAGLLPAGVYDFEITSAVSKTSGSGNEMFEINLNVFEHDGAARSIRTWALPKMPKQWKHLHDACGLIKQYESGETEADDLVGKTGKLKLIQSKYTNTDGLEIAVNRVDDYIKRENLISGNPLDSDEIPFG